MTTNPTPEQEAKIDRAADAIDRFMDKLDEISNPEMYKELQDTRSDLAEARAEAKRFEEQWELALHEIAEMKAERDTLRNRWQSIDILDAIEAMVELAGEEATRYEEIWSGRRDRNIAHNARLIKLVRDALNQADAEQKPAQPERLTPDPASLYAVMGAPAETTKSGEVDDVAAAAIELYRAGDIGGAQRLILEDLIARERCKSQKRGESSTTGSGAAAGDGADA